MSFRMWEPHQQRHRSGKAHGRTFSGLLDVRQQHLGLRRALKREREYRTYLSGPKKLQEETACSIEKLGKVQF